MDLLHNQLGQITHELNILIQQQMQDMMNIATKQAAVIEQQQIFSDKIKQFSQIDFAPRHELIQRLKKQIDQQLGEIQVINKQAEQQLNKQNVKNAKEMKELASMAELALK
ncbi:Hypothetical_protein [Hexamita inflata]|uniref:Hypothetical_protein n=1 Tax=Hexamita inflata TaxID=28002 RepID=A0AA86PL98_9EUKA|nr:Hypothetical protein HINF_LOCUS27942 [Hexamita inflata]